MSENFPINICKWYELELPKCQQKRADRDIIGYTIVNQLQWVHGQWSLGRAPGSWSEYLLISYLYKSNTKNNNRSPVKFMIRSSRRMLSFCLKHIIYIYIQAMVEMDTVPVNIKNLHRRLFFKFYWSGTKCKIMNIMKFSCRLLFIFVKITEYSWGGGGIFSERNFLGYQKQNLNSTHTKNILV